MSAQEFIDDLNKIETLAGVGMQTLTALNPEASTAVNGIAVVLPIISELVSVALNAWSKANGQPITPETIQALLPNQTPLSPPDAA